MSLKKCLKAQDSFLTSDQKRGVTWACGLLDGNKHSLDKINLKGLGEIDSPPRLVVEGREWRGGGEATKCSHQHWHQEAGGPSATSHVAAMGSDTTITTDTPSALSFEGCVILNEYSLRCPGLRKSYLMDDQEFIAILFGRWSPAKAKGYEGNLLNCQVRCVSWLEIHLLVLVLPANSCDFGHIAPSLGLHLPLWLVNSMLLFLTSSSNIL